MWSRADYVGVGQMGARRTNHDREFCYGYDYHTATYTCYRTNTYTGIIFNDYVFDTINFVTYIDKGLHYL